jgi:polysaccharide export outer membrane protein
MIARMKWRHPEFLAIAAACTLALSTTQAQEPQEPQPQQHAPYTINPGDVLIVAVWKEPDLQQQVVVRPDGAFSFPLVGDVHTDGKSVEDIEKIVSERLTRYIPDPVVTVSVAQIVGNSVYVIGQVQRPGQFVVPSRVDVIQALSLAGGTTPFAKLGNIKILRRVEGSLTAIPFDYADIEKGKRLHQNIVLEPGDVVVVP